MPENEESDEEDAPEEEDEMDIERAASPSSMESGGDERPGTGESGDSMPPLESVSDTESDEGGDDISVDVPRRSFPLALWLRRARRQLALRRAREDLQDHVVGDRDKEEERVLCAENAALVRSYRMEIETASEGSRGERKDGTAHSCSDARPVEDAGATSLRGSPRIADAEPGSYAPRSASLPHKLPSQHEGSADTLVNESPVIVYSVLVDTPRLEHIFGLPMNDRYDTQYTPRSLSPLETLEYPRTQSATPEANDLVGLDAVMEGWEAEEAQGEAAETEGNVGGGLSALEAPRLVITRPTGTDASDEPAIRLQGPLDRLRVLASVAAHVAQSLRFEQEAPRRNELGDQNGMITISRLYLIHEALTRIVLAVASEMRAQEPLNGVVEALLSPLLSPRPGWDYVADTPQPAPPLPRPDPRKLFPQPGAYNPLFDPYASILGREEFLYGPNAHCTKLAPIPFFGPQRTRPNIAPLYPDSFIPIFDSANDLSAMTGPFDLPLDEVLSTDEEDEESFVFDSQRDTLEHRGILYDADSGCELTPATRRFRRYLEKLIADLLIMENSPAETQLQIEQYYSWLRQPDRVPTIDHVPFDMRPNFRHHYTLRAFRRIPGPLRREMFLPENMARLEPTIRRAYLSLRASSYLGARDLRRPCLTDPLVVFNVNFVALRFWRNEFASFFRALEGALPLAVRSEMWNQTLHLVHEPRIQDGHGDDAFRTTNPLFNLSESIFLCTYVKWLQQHGEVNLARAIRYVLEYVFGDQAEVRHLTFNQYLDVVDEPDDPQAKWAATTLASEV
ncbi:hypothetical protein FA95DRAFT_1578609 [Auriscalpium vulgare]|uniref:Uncharacterized protein n=1 Tax=Auriscalpium vulgare TaxID=40419 RepID=A0ACB8R0V6_9AGAM|nr:hypothetical protein FA95DRAFT_1578609 [Auriscalpium vulgare]